MATKTLSYTDIETFLTGDVQFPETQYELANEIHKALTEMIDRNNPKNPYFLSSNINLSNSNYNDVVFKPVVSPILPDPNGKLVIAFMESRVKSAEFGTKYKITIEPLIPEYEQEERKREFIKNPNNLKLNIINKRSRASGVTTMMLNEALDLMLKNYKYKISFICFNMDTAKSTADSFREIFVKRTIENADNPRFPLMKMDNLYQIELENESKIRFMSYSPKLFKSITNNCVFIDNAECFNFDALNTLISNGVCPSMYRTFNPILNISTMDTGSLLRMDFLKDMDMGRNDREPNYTIKSIG